MYDTLQGVDKTMEGEMTSPTQRTLKMLKQQGRICGTVERFLQYAGPFGKRVDLFGFIDIISLSDDGIVGVQSCGQSFSEHRKKMLENEILPKWLKHAKVELIGWRKVKAKKGGKAMVWKPRVGDFIFKEGVVVCEERR